MKDDFIPVNTPLLSGNEKKYINECIDTGWISSEGPFVERFESELSAKVNRKYGIAVSSGTAALDIAVVALDIGKGDEVILPSHTIISCISAITRSGATPVLVDSELATWNMDVNLIESKITNKTKAIMAVHVYGFPMDMDIVLDLAKKYNLFVIEDAAQMLGQTYKGKPCGSFGDISTFSFYPNKQITTGEGGMCVVNDEKLADRCRSFRNLCFKHPRFVHDEIGWNYRMTNMQAALGVAQLEKLDSHVKRKREIAKKYIQLINFNDLIKASPEANDYSDNIYWVVGLLISDSSNYSAQDVMNYLTEHGVGVRPFFYPLHMQPVFKEQGMFKGEQYPNSEKLYKKGFYIPSGLGITDNEISIVASKVNQLIRKFFKIYKV
jgi:perosamine synthetase